MTDEYTPEVLVFDDKQKQAQTIIDLLQDDFNMFPAIPSTLGNVIRDSVDVILSDVQIIERGQKEMEGPDIVEDFLRKIGIARPVIVYSHVKDLSLIKNSPKGEIYFDYVSMVGYDWSDDLADKIRRAYASRVQQKGKMFKYWCEQYGIIDEKVLQDGVQRLHDFGYNYEQEESLTYRTIIGEFESEFLDDTRSDVYSGIIFTRLKNCEGFTDQE